MRAARLFLTLIALTVSAAALQAQVVEPGHPTVGSTTKSAKRPQGTNAPIPPALTSAHKVFLANGGSDAGLFPHPFTGTQDRAYGYLYQALSAGGRFQIVDSPAKADIVLELQLSSPLGPLGNNKQKGTADPLPTFKLIVYDRPSHYVLWTITQTIDPANLQKTHDKNFDTALDLLIAQLMDTAK